MHRISRVHIAIGNKIREYIEHHTARRIQDALDLSQLKNSRKVIVFFIPVRPKINGGVMSIFSLCSASRKAVDNAFCCLSTYPNGRTYVINDKFYNNEKILRFEQIVCNAKNVHKMILHIPEYYADDFYKDLTRPNIEFLKSIPDLQINILNQNIELMPSPESLHDLYKLTNNITQTMAHESHATQDICNKWQMPTHYFGTYLDMSPYEKYPFEKKEKIIVLSPDKNKYKNNIVNRIKKELPDWKIITVKDMTFSEYMDLISKAYFTITFGEGFDGYFLQPFAVNSIGFAVYSRFFADKSWLDFQNVFESYEDMHENIVGLISKLHNNKEKYSEISNFCRKKQEERIDLNQYTHHLKRFYKREYDFLPNTRNNK